MIHRTCNAPHTGTTMPRLAALLAGLGLALAALLAACGGVGSGGTGSFASGPITGFGSIIVGGVHYEEGLARVESDDGTARSADQLRLGMVVEVLAGDIVAEQAQASSIRLVSELVGRVDAVDADAGVLTVNGVRVRCHAGTMFDATLVGGLSGLSVGNRVEVYGLPAVGELSATRIEPRPEATSFKFRGELSAHSAGNRSFRIGDQLFDYRDLADPPASLADGVALRVTVAPTPGAGGAWQVQTLALLPPPPADLAALSVDGVIARMLSPTQFRLRRFIVEAAGAQLSGGVLAQGQRVSVQGALRDGVLLASRISVQSEAGGEFDLRGVIASVDAGAKTFRYNGRGETVSFARSDVVFDGGDASTLQPGRPVRARGSLSADGARLEATRIDFLR